MDGNECVLWMKTIGLYTSGAVGRETIHIGYTKQKLCSKQNIKKNIKKTSKKCQNNHILLISYLLSFHEQRMDISTISLLFIFINF